MILATGSSHIDLPFMPCDEELILSVRGRSICRGCRKLLLSRGLYRLELGRASQTRTEVTVIEGMGRFLQ